MLEDYIMPGDAIIPSTDVREQAFKEVMRNTIVPLHRFALNRGFGVWTGR